MMIHEMTLDECLKALAQVSIGRLACAREGQPYVGVDPVLWTGNH